METIYSILAILVCVVGVVWGWWYENGPERKNVKPVPKKAGEEDSATDTEKEEEKG